MANTVLAKMAVQIAANTAEFNKALSQTNKNLTNFTGGITKIAGTIGAAFGVQQIASFGFGMAKLAGEAQGVEAAFNRLPNATRLLVDLKNATGNTVSELELMKRAVQASNFDISLSALPKLLEFATLRAQQTGQSVDYLVDSIVTGIGRKSKLILDNLGISATQLAAEFNGASLEAQNVGDVTEAVGRIAERNLKNMAGFSQNTATGVKQLSASWDDLKVSIGKIINQSGLSKLISEFASIAKFFAGDFTMSVEQVNNVIAQLIVLRQKAKEEGNREDEIKYTKAIAELSSKYNILKNKTIDTTKAFVDQTITLDKLQEKRKQLNEQFNQTDTNDKKTLQNIGDQIIAIDAQIKKIEELRKAKEETDPVNTLIRQSNARTPQEFAKDNPITNAVGTLSNGDFLNGAMQRMQDFIKTIKTLPVEFRAVQEEMVDISGLIVNGITDIADAFGQAVVGGAQDFGKSFLRSLGNFAQQFGGMLIAIGIGERTLKLGTPGQKIAAGIALVALGGAVKALLSKPPSMSGSSGGSISRGGDAFQRQSLILEGNFKIEGRDLVLAYDKNKGLDNKRK